MRFRGYFYLWLLVLVFCSLYATMGRLLGFVRPEILNSLFFGAEGWWTLPTAVHGVAAVVQGTVLALLGRWFYRNFGLPRRGDRRLLLVLFIVLGLVLCLNQFGELKNVVSGTTDFGTILQAAQAVGAGEDPYAATSNGYFYPPVLAFLLIGLTWLPPAGASTLFFSGKILMVLWVLLACDRLADGGRFRGGIRTLFLFGLVFVGARFWITDLQFGNTNVLILFLMLAAVHGSLNDRQTWAGIALALAFTIKLIPGILVLFFLLNHRWRALAWFAAGTLALILLPWLIQPASWWHTWGWYFDAGVTGKLGERLAQPDNQSVWGLLNRLFPATPLTTLRLLWLATGLLLTALVGWVTRQTRHLAAPAPLVGASLFMLVGLLMSPGSWVVHYTATLPALVALWRIALGGRRHAFYWAVFAVANFAFTVSGWARALVAPSIEQSWFVLAALLLVVALGVWGWRESISGSQIPGTGRAQP